MKNSTVLTTDTEPIEVSEKQYNYLMFEYAGCVAGRKEDGKFYIKIWACRRMVESYLKSSK